MIILNHPSTIKDISTIFINMNYCINKKLEKYGFKRTHFHILHYLYNNEGCSQNELVNTFLLDKVKVTKTLTLLEKNGYIEKKKDPKDKRINGVYLTTQGKNIQNDLHDILFEINNKLINNISEEEELILKKLLEKISHNIFSLTNELKNIL